MPISHDNATAGTAYVLTGTQTVSHIGGASAKAACVLISQNGSVADQVTSVTYAGTPMLRVGFQTEATEAGAVYLYWLDSIVSGTQNVAMTTSGSIDKQMVIATMNIGLSTNFVYLGGTGTGTSASIANPSWTITVPTGNAYMAYEVIHSGLQTMTNTPASGWTLISSTDLGSQGRGSARLTAVTSTATTSITSGWTAATSDDYVGLSAAFYEGSPPVNFESWGSIPIN